MHGVALALITAAECHAVVTRTALRAPILPSVLYGLVLWYWWALVGTAVWKLAERSGTSFFSFGSADDFIREFQFVDARLLQEPISHTAIKFVYPGASPSISANRSQNGIVWAIENLDTAVLHAYDATDLSHELYNSDAAPSGRDHFGAGNKFITPMVAYGKVYVGTTNGVGVFGLLSEK